MSRPEHEAPPEIFYGDDEARKYSNNSRIMQIQMEMTQRAIELLNLPQRQCLLLDIGCGSGLSGEELTEEGHVWMGLDISQSMLNVARERESEGDLFLSDAGEGVFFRPGIFDGAISISALQWLCNSDHAGHNPAKRLSLLFTSLYTAMTRGARAVFQFYPENPTQVELITNSALRAGFTGGVVVDFPNSTKRKKYFLCLFAGTTSIADMPRALDDTNAVDYVGAANAHARRERSARHNPKDREWILRKKQLARKRGKDVPLDTRYTGRKRHHKKP